jgi:hypothetical protein
MGRLNRVSNWGFFSFLDVFLVFVNGRLNANQKIYFFEFSVSARQSMWVLDDWFLGH